MKALLTVPIFFTLIIGFSMQLIDIAETTSTKALNFAEDMNKAMDCAILGKNISLCSPDLMGYDFTPEADRTLEILETFQSDAAIYVNLDDINKTKSSS